jgi:hypothetical protein
MNNVHIAAKKLYGFPNKNFANLGTSKVMAVIAASE